MSTLAGKQLLINWKKTIEVWWSFFWRTFIYVLLLGAFLGTFAGVFALVSGAPDKGGLYGAVVGWIASIPASMFALKQALTKHIASLVGHATE